MRMNVRCCCKPEKMLGTLEVPDDYAERDGFYIEPLQPKFTPISARPAAVAVEQHWIVIRTFCKSPYDWSERAIFSEDRPIEFWRRLPGFQEVRRRG